MNTQALLERIDASLERCRTILDRTDAIIEDMNRAAATAEQQAFESRNRKWNNIHTKGQITDERGRTQ